MDGTNCHYSVPLLHTLFFFFSANFINQTSEHESWPKQWYFCDEILIGINEFISAEKLQDFETGKHD